MRCTVLYLLKRVTFLNTISKEILYYSRKVFHPFTSHAPLITFTATIVTRSLYPWHFSISRKIQHMKQPLFFDAQVNFRCFVTFAGFLFRTICIAQYLNFSHFRDVHDTNKTTAKLSNRKHLPSWEILPSNLSLKFNFI